MNTEPFGAIPHQIGADKRINNTAKNLVHALLYFAKDSHETGVGNRDLAVWMGRSERTVQVAMRSLVNAG